MHAFHKKIVSVPKKKKTERNVPETKKTILMFLNWFPGFKKSGTFWGNTTLRSERWDAVGGGLWP